MLLVDFGDTGRKHRGKRPVCVISSDKNIADDSILMVIPLYRKPSRDNKGHDVLIPKDDCKGLRYDEYAGITNISKVRRKQIVRYIGHIENETVIGALAAAFLKKVGEGDEKCG